MISWKFHSKLRPGAEIKPRRGIDKLFAVTPVFKLYSHTFGHAMFQNYLPKWYFLAPLITHLAKWLAWANGIWQKESETVLSQDLKGHCHSGTLAIFHEQSKPHTGPVQREGGTHHTDLTLSVWVKVHLTSIWNNSSSVKASLVQPNCRWSVDP